MGIQAFVVIIPYWFGFAGLICFSKWIGKFYRNIRVPGKGILFHKNVRFVGRDP